MADTTVIGNVGSCDIRFTNTGKAVTTVSIAENHRKKDQNGQYQDDGVTWRRVTFWERMAESVADEIQKGQMVIVTGDERLKEFTAKDGSTGQSLEIQGRRIGRLVLPKRDDTQNQPQQNQGWSQPSGNTAAQDQYVQQAASGAGPWQPAGQDPWAGAQPGGQQDQDAPF